MYRVLLSSTFVRQFRKLPRPDQTRVRRGLEALEEDPRGSRPGADIKMLEATDPPKHRLRVGELRVIYRIEGRNVLAIEVFRRGRGYRRG